MSENSGIPATSKAAADRVLNCQNLPSLPGVAMRVLELTANQGVSAQEIATTIQNDPALTTKVLRTVNSSYYGLSTPCPSIRRATSLLGINTVKSIVLGFSLVESTKRAGLERTFDMLAYWRRAVYSAAGARCIAVKSGRCDPEEAFVGALVQDIGVLACAATLKAEYDQVCAQAPGDHDLLAPIEKALLGIDHTEIGAHLAERWRLPPQIAECIKQHHTPDKCRPEHQQLLRTVALGGLAAAFLADTNQKRKLGAFVSSAREWYGIEQPVARDLLVQINDGATQLSKTLEIKTGESADLSGLMSQAHEQLVATQEQIQRETIELRKNNQDLELRSITDALTGAFNRAHFDREIAAAFQKSGADKSPLSVLFCDGDKFKNVNDTHGHPAGDAVLIELSKRLRDALTGIGTVCRCGGEEFAIIVPGADADRALKLAEVIRRRIAATGIDVSAAVGSPTVLPVTISIGVATHDPRVGAAFPGFEQLVQAADQGVYAAKRDGRNCVRAVGRNEAPRPASEVIKVLFVEDDPMAARLMGFLFDKHREFSVTFVASGEEALESVAKSAPDLVISDLNLAGISGIQIAAALRSKPATAALPFVIVSATVTDKIRAQALDAGVAHCIDKTDLLGKIDAWIATFTQLSRGLRKAA
ncbi:MAG: HDOD domain-containing protein [Planctomycetes bacterium]|nr:HDOD domain-containing protein [Planctomycetota bacterium]